MNNITSGISKRMRLKTHTEDASFKSNNQVVNGK